MKISPGYITLVIGVFTFLSGSFLGFPWGTQQAEATLTVCGSMDMNTTWSVKDSPIIITCTTTVNAGVTLTVDPGVQVRFPRGSAQGRVSLIIEGTLIARGTEEQNILFTSDEKNALPGDWASMTFINTGAATGISNKNGKDSRESVLEFCVVEFGGSAGRVGAIEVHGTTLSLNRVVVQKNASSGVEVRDGTITVKDSTLMSNSNSQGLGGGIIAHTSTIVLDGTTVKKNAVAGTGGGIYALASQLSLTNSAVLENKADGKGGGIFATDSTLTIKGGSFAGNISSYRGGALYTSRVKVTIDDTEFIGNRAELTSVTIGHEHGDSRGVAFGGAAYFDKSDVNIKRSAFIRNFAGDQCGALAVENSNFHVHENVFIENTAEVNGTALCLSGSNTGSSITHNAFTDNYPPTGKAANTIYFATGPLPQFSKNSLFEPGKIIIHNQTDTMLDAKSNWWGTPNDAIQDRILGLATFLPALDQPEPLPKITMKSPTNRWQRPEAHSTINPIHPPQHGLAPSR